MKEFVAVFVQLVCYSRLGQVDLFQGGLILYMVLVVFSFPFLNSYLYGFLRFGMWVYKMPDNKMSWTLWFARTVLQFLCMTVFQIMGAIAAAETVKAIQSEWGDAVLRSYNDVPSELDGNYKAIGVVYEGPKAEITVGVYFMEELCAVFILLIGLLHLIAKESEGLLLNTYWRARSEPVVENPDKAGMEPGMDNGGNAADVASISAVDGLNPSESFGFVSETDSVKRLLGEVVSNIAGVKRDVESIRVYIAGRHHHSKSSAIDESAEGRKPKVLKPLPAGNGKSTVSPGPEETVHASGTGMFPPVPGATGASVGSRFGANLDTASFFIGAETPDVSTSASVPPKYHKQPAPALLPIPSTLIIHASILIMAISRAFPSAHQSLHLSIFFSQMGYTSRDTETIERVCGGYVACLAALAYYWFWYVYAGMVQSDSDDGKQKGRGYVRRNHMEGPPAFMSSELRLPKYMRMDDDGSRSA
jgi:hypothetical protein